jgi:chromosomal replication initiator protein
MSLILSIVISFFVSLITSFFFLKLGNKKNEEKVRQLESQLQKHSESEDENKYENYHSIPRKDLALDNFYTDDSTFIETMKSILDDGTSRKPIIITGSSGTGKTHLLRAFENYILNKDPLKKVCYISAEAFTNEFINSIKCNQKDDFRARYRNLDALLIDDFDCFRNKEATQQELVFTITELLDKNAFVCVSLPDINALEKNFSDKLVSLVTGIKIQIPEQGFEAKRLKIMETFEKAGCFVNGDLVDYLASPSISLNEIVGICQKIILMKQLEGKGCVNLDIDEIKVLLK